MFFGYLKKKQGQFGICIELQKSYEETFSFFFFYYFWKQTFFFCFSCLIRKIRRKLKISLHNFVRNSMQIPKMSLFSFLLAFFFYSFEGLKTHYTGEANIHNFNVQLHYTSPPIPFGPPIRVFSGRDTSFTYTPNTQSEKKIVFTKTVVKQTRPLPPFDASLG